MIDNNIREKMKPVLGGRFSGEVQSILEEAGKETYSPGFISNVFNGRYENEDIESALLALYAKKLKAKKTLAKQMQKIAKEKPERAGSGSN